MRLVLATLTVLVFLSSVQSQAQDWSSEQLEVWRVVLGQWESSKNKDASWPDTLLHPSFLGWANDNPMPRNKTSTKNWDRFDSANSTTLEQELNPVGIVVAGSTAVVHYYYSTATRNYQDEIETSHGRYTDILIKEGERWRFLGWSGGEVED